MKGYTVTGEKKLVEREIVEEEFDNKCKIKITKSLISFADVLRYKGEIDCNNIVLGSSGIGIVVESDANMLDVEKGKHVYVEPTKECGKCYNCLSNNKNKCLDMLIAGEDYDGFLRDFLTVPVDKVFSLPENIPDTHALLIKDIALAVSIITELNIQKGDYVSIVGANNFGNILAQLVSYYSSVPIVLTNDDDEFNRVKNSGIYYVLGKDDNWQKEVSLITGGRMTDKVVYVADCDIAFNKAFSVASNGAKVAFTGISYKSNSINLSQAVKKELTILCINSGFKNTATSINLLSNKAINFEHLQFDKINYQAVPKTFEKLCKQLEEDKKINDVIVENE